MKRDLSSLGSGEREIIRARLLRMRSVDPQGCWLWTGARNDAGYGITRVLGRAGWTERVHRLSFLILGGRAPQEYVLHRCDVRACFNPAHLFEGTALDNTRDMMAKSRDRFPEAKRGELSPSAKLSEDDVREIVRASLAGATRADLARRFGVRIDTISKIVLGKNWAHITADCGVAKSPRGGRRVER